MPRSRGLGREGVGDGAGCRLGVRGFPSEVSLARSRVRRTLRVAAVCVVDREWSRLLKRSTQPTLTPRATVSSGPGVKECQPGAGGLSPRYDQGGCERVGCDRAGYHIVSGKEA